MARHPQKAGFTFIEIIIVLAVIVILCGIVVKMFVTLNQSQAVEKDAHLIVETLTQARSQTLASKNQSQYGVHIASTTITLFAGANYSAADSANLIYSLNNRDTVSAVSVTGGGTNIIFTRLTGETSQNGTLTISSKTSASTTKTVTIYKTGLIETN